MFVYFISTLLLSVYCCCFTDSSCPREWFGDYCQYRCHCLNNTCTADGSCKGTPCEKGWFGYKCQYRNLAVPESDWLKDDNDTTCNDKNNIDAIFLRLDSENIFTWLKLVFNVSMPIRFVSLQFKTTTNSTLGCLDQKILQTDSKTLQIWCFLNVTVDQINITGEGVRSLCSVYVSGGRNVALKQPTNQTSTYGDDDTWRRRSESVNAVDGNTDSSFDRGSCTHTAGGDTSPTWTVRFNETFLVNTFVLYNRDKDKKRLIGFKLQAFDRNSSILLNYMDNKSVEQDIYSISQLLMKPTSQVQITGTNTGDLFLTLCEVEIFGDCTEGKKGLGCNETCTNKCPLDCNGNDATCDFVCFGAVDPPACQSECPMGSWGLNCTKSCVGKCWESNCDKKNGFCLSGCHGHMNPPYCTQVCSDIVWGLNCSKNCSSNCNNFTCDRLTGACHFGCLPGYLGPDCIRECPLGYWGSGCTEQCLSRCVRGNCSKETGLCLEGCHGYSDPPNCTIAMQTDNETSNIGIIVGPVVAVVLILCLAVLLFFFWRRRLGTKTKQKRTEEMTFAQTHSLPTKHDGVNVAAPHSDVNSSEIVEDETNTGAGYYSSIQSGEEGTAISVPYFDLFMETHKKTYFTDQFKMIPTAVDVSMENAQTEHNKGKNRYKNICTYDHSRVNLKINSEKNEGDYINASYIKGFGDKVEFIASQGPNKTILNDFVRMLWEQETQKIVMLTNLTEEGKTKCEQYWPDEGKTMFGDIKVKLLTTARFSDYTVRRLELSKKNEETHHLTHYQYHAWPDKGVPAAPWSLVDFVHKVSATSSSHLTVVHCSAGVGRTGTFIALLNIIKQATETGMMDFLQTVAKLRQDRIFMVQTSAQYEFLHKAAQTALLCMNSTVAADELKTKITKIKQKSLVGQSGIELEWKHLCDVCSNVNTEERLLADGENDDVYQNTHTISHEGKNRFIDILPKQMYRPFLNATIETTDDYINAVFIQGLKQKDRYLLSQLPMHKTVDDFWRLVTQYKVNVIVAFEMDEINKDETIAQYFPTEASKVLQTSMFEITSTSCKQTLFWDDQRLTVKCTSHTACEKQDVINITTLYKDLNAKKWLSLLKHIQTCSKSTGKMVFLCKNGAQYSGLACVLTLLLERMDIEMKVNVPLVVGSVKLIRPEVVPNIEQYRLIYDVLELYHHTSGQYASVGDRFLKEML